MARYIDADLLLQRLTGVNSSVEQGVKYFNSVYNIINEQPISDVVEITRCKDCSCSKEIDNVLYCTYFNKNVNSNDFCSNGG